ncbi:MAG: hypothetical protein AB7I32_14475 [Gammaproteobacteria bacterium]
MELRHITALCVSLSLVLSAAPAKAATATWSVSATINHVDDFLSSLFDVGDSVRGTLIIEEKKHSCSAGLCHAFASYDDVVHAAELDVGDIHFLGQAPALSNYAWVSRGSDDADSFRLFLDFDNEENESATPGIDEVVIYFEYSAGSALASADFPLTPPPAELFDVTSLQILFGRQTLSERCAHHRNFSRDCR